MIPLIALAAVIAILVIVLWPRLRRRPTGDDNDMPANIGEEGVRARALALRDQLDRTPFGEQLARAVWHALMACPVDEGVIHSFHRDFCGQGLIRTADGVKLCDIDDGGYNTGPPIAVWHTEAAFTGFFARQSDFSCSGWDPGEPVFATDDEWYRNNQRLTRDLLERFAAGA